VLAHAFPVPLLHAFREIADQVGFQTRVVRQVARHQIVEEHQLGISEQHTDLGPRQPPAILLALHHFLRGRQLLDLAVKEPARFQRFHEAFLMAEIGRTPVRGKRDRQCLAVVVCQHQARHVFGHVRKKLVPLLPRQPVLAHGIGERDLDVDLDVGGVHPRRIVDRI
jgi:hypothetical protein